MSFFKYNGNVFSSVEDLLAALKMDGIFEEQDDWQIQKYTSFKEYDAAEFLQMAEKYRNESPPDLIQSSEKLWLAVVYTIKLFFLNMDIHLASHRSLSFFYDLAIDNSSFDGKILRRLDKAWHLAEKLHSFAYGTPAFTIAQFPDVYAEIKFFIEEFPKIEGSKIKLEINNLMADFSNAKRKDIDFLITYYSSAYIFAGGLKVQPVNDPQVQEFAQKAMAIINEESNTAYHQVLIEVLSARLQIVTGTKYEIILLVGETECKYNTYTNLCSFSPEKLNVCVEDPSKFHKRKVYTITVWLNSLDNFEKIKVKDVTYYAS